ncbi:MAG: hypothetical protein H7338_17415 [Candidatus Sericytochromatia bacterium]|nr:hypothetical protein [Candidatus Sericytochromatia bacterium]
MSNPEDDNAKKPFPIHPLSWEEATSPGLTHVKKSPRLERLGRMRLPDQPGQAIDMNEPGIEAALDAAEAELAPERPRHGHKGAGDSAGY